jgi:hypothetical protein
VFQWGTFIWELVSYSKVCVSVKVCVGVNVGERIGVCVCVCVCVCFVLQCFGR